MSDDEIIEALTDLDGDEDVDVTSWEAEFIESVCFKNPRGTLSERQREKALEIIERYEGR